MIFGAFEIKLLLWLVGGVCLGFALRRVTDALSRVDWNTRCDCGRRLTHSFLLSLFPGFAHYFAYGRCFDCQMQYIERRQLEGLFNVSPIRKVVSERHRRRL